MAPGVMAVPPRRSESSSLPFTEKQSDLAEASDVELDDHEKEDSSINEKDDRWRKCKWAQDLGTYH